MISWKLASIGSCRLQSGKEKKNLVWSLDSCRHSLRKSTAHSWKRSDFRIYESHSQDMSSGRKDINLTVFSQKWADEFVCLVTPVITVCSYFLTYIPHEHVCWVLPIGQLPVYKTLTCSAKRFLAGNSMIRERLGPVRGLSNSRVMLTWSSGKAEMWSPTKLTECWLASDKIFSSGPGSFQ